MKDNIGIIGYIFMIIFGLCVTAYMLNSAYNSSIKSNHEIHSTIGKKIILDKDTLTIIDYSIFTNSYILSNNLKVDKSFVDSLIIKSIK